MGISTKRTNSITGSADLEAEVVELRERNAHLVSQLVNLVRGGALERKAASQSHPEAMRQFVECTSRAQLDGEDLYELVAQAFLELLGSDRVSILFHAGAGGTSLVAVQQACAPGTPEVPVPYFIAANKEDPYRQFLEDVLVCGDSLHRTWPQPIEIHPQLYMHAGCARAFQAESGGGAWIFCLQWKNADRSSHCTELMEELSLYAGVLLEQDHLLGSLRELRDQNESLIQSMPSAIIGLDVLGTVTLWNGKAEALFGISREQASDRSFAQLLPQFRSLVDKLVSVLQSDGEELVLEPVAFRNRSGIVRHLQPHLFHLLTSARGEVAIRIDDITRQLDNQKQLLHAQRMETLGALAGGIAEDFSESLGGILGSGTRMRRRWRERGEPSPHDSEDLDVLLHCARRASDLVHRLLLLSRQPKEGLAPVDLVECLRTVYNLCFSSLSPTIRIHLETIAEVAWIAGNSSQLENTLLNLCLNARDAMPQGGDLYLRLQQSASAPAQAGVSAPSGAGPYWVVEVADTGCGMSSEVQSRIFDPFYTTRAKSGGTGLGLVIVERSLESHKGFLDLQSDVDKGTLFRLFFPCLREVGQSSPLRGTPPGAVFPQQILVVDDNEVARKVTQRILVDCGFSVQTVADGHRALEIFSAGEFALVILESGLPGMGGHETARMLRSLRPGQRLLFTVVRPGEMSPHGFSQDGPTGLLEKPYTFDQLESVVRSLLS